MINQETEIKCFIDQAFINQAEAQIYLILFNQRQAFNQRWFQHPVMNKLKTNLRWLGLIMCLAGMAVMLLSLTLEPTWRFTEWQVYGLLLFFITGTWFFFKLPMIDIKAKAWADNTSQKSCRKLAKKSVKQAKSMLPFSAHYEIKGDLISYYRKLPKTVSEKSCWHFVWNRKMSGYAVQTRCSTVFFKKPKSIQPRMVVLHEHPDELNYILGQHQVTVKVISTEQKN